jgi:cobalt-zinc-cadmium efflux system membrane fusion protein
MKTNFVFQMRSVVITAAMIASAAALSGCGSDATRKASEMASFSDNATAGDRAQLFSVPQDQMAHIEMLSVTPSRLERSLRFTGAVSYNAFRTTPVISPVGGPVTRLLVAPGEYVKQGQSLLEISSPDFAQARSTYLKAHDGFHLADKNYSRAQDLYAHQAIAERDLQQAESDRNQARADLESAEQTLQILGIPKPEGLETATPSPVIPLLAPISGQVTDRMVAPGQLLQAGATQAFTISDLSTVWVLASIYEKDLAYVNLGEAATITSDAYPGQTFHGTISYVTPTLDPNTRTAQARIVVENPHGELKNNMYVNASVAAGTIQNALAVPDAAVLRDSENMPFVYVDMGKNAQGTQQFARRLVEIGDTQGGQTQILSGLKPGERVVSNGGLFLQFANSMQK